MVGNWSLSLGKTLGNSMKTNKQMPGLDNPIWRSGGLALGLLVCMHAKLLQSCPTLCDPMDCSLPGSSVLGILQERVLEWAAVPSSRGSSQGLNLHLLHLLNCQRILYRWATGEALGPLWGCLCVNPSAPVGHFPCTEGTAAFHGLEDGTWAQKCGQWQQGVNWNTQKS